MDVPNSGILAQHTVRKLGAMEINKALEKEFDIVFHA